MSRGHLARVVALALLIGCAVWSRLIGEGGGAISTFNHQVHAEDGGLECTDCHEGASTEKAAGMPSLETCYGCHDEENPTEAFSLWLAGKQVVGREAPLAKPVVTASFADVRFDHAAHLSRGAACADCHGALETATEIGRDVLPVMADCLACHDATPASCEICHEDIRADAAPPSHQASWTRIHGRSLRVAAGDPSGLFNGAGEARCQYCHEENSCVTCHRSQRPADHSQNWEFRGHGHAAAIDRERCAVCHQEAACAECHAIAEPRSHTSGWGGPFQRHCTSCHEPLEANGCGACHQATPRHAERPLPGDHIAGSDCRSCHINLKHRDDGGDCERCHQ